MDPITSLAASGMRARIESLELLANNLANTETLGYKADQEYYGLYTGPESSFSETMPVIERNWTNFTQGTLKPTGNPLDVALSGEGFFSVDGPSGPLYTRAGAFRLGKDGTLLAADGNAVRKTGGGHIVLDPAQQIEISADGDVIQGGVTAGRIEVVSFKDKSALVKAGSNYFRNADQKTPPGLASGTEVRQGALEGSNVGAPEAAVRLIGVMRQFEMLQKAVGIGSEMNRKAIEEVAKVGS